MCENYLDGFVSAEEYLRREILPVMGGANSVSRKRMVELCREQLGVDWKFTGRNKTELFDLLLAHCGKKVYALLPVGVYGRAFQHKFGITRVELGKLAKLGIVGITGQARLRDGSVFQLFNAWDYFHLDPEVIRAAVERIRTGSGRMEVTK